MTSKVLDKKKTIAFLAHALIGEGVNSSDYEARNSALVSDLKSMPVEDLSVALGASMRAEILDCTEFLVTAYNRGFLLEACRLFDAVVVPNVTELQAGVHRITGALRIVLEEYVDPGYMLPTGKEKGVLAALKVECALDRNEVIGAGKELRAYAAANPHVADRLVLAIDQRKTVELDVLRRMVEADALAEGVL